jgi:hypothetical protein
MMYVNKYAATLAHFTGSVGIWNLRKMEADKAREPKRYKQRVFTGNGRLLNLLK